LVKAIPAVIKKHPDVLFRFIGEDGYCSLIDDKMSVYINRMLGAWPRNVELTGGVAYPTIVEYLGKTEICIFPSVWENFPMVCLEAMSAGCAVVGSKEGGMTEMLADDHGILIDPQSVTDITNALLSLLADSKLRVRLGTVAREKVLKEYNSSKIGQEIETCYFNVIEMCQKS
jgi:glycogen synthase